jgi:hypothetical protein
MASQNFGSPPHSSRPIPTQAHIWPAQYGPRGMPQSRVIADRTEWVHMPAASAPQQLSSEHMVVPVEVTHTKIRSRTDNQFAYHDPAYGCGFRFHYKDNLDDALLDLPVRHPTSLTQLAHQGFLQELQEEWGNAGLRETAVGLRRRWPPGSRRLRESELREMQAIEAEDQEDIVNETRRMQITL